ncbi:MAG: hypothetical protein AB7K24_24720 [Gemmataceae bacterium]
MNSALQEQIEALANEFKQATMPDKCKATAAWCLGQLPSLYRDFYETSESRHVEQIAHLVGGMVKEFQAATDCEDAKQFAATVPDRFSSLHEEYGLPRLKLKLSSPTPTRSRKAS